MTKDEYIELNINKLFYSWLNILLISGAVFILLLGFLDYVSTPSNFKKFLIYRIVAVAIVLLLYLVNRIKVSKALQNSVTILSGLIVSTMVALMISKFGGHQSPYFAGMMLVIVFVLGFVPVDIKISAVTSMIIYGNYLLPILFYDNISNESYFFAANGFILAIAFIVLLTRYLNQKRLSVAFGLQYEIEDQKKQLEEYSVRLEQKVEERTKELEVLNEQLRQSQKMEAIGLLAGGIAHDFSNILTTIKGSIYIISKDLDKTSPMLKYTEQTLSSVNKANNLTQSLLAFSRKQTFVLQPVSLNKVINKAENLLAQVLGEHIELTKILTEKNTVIMADRNQIEQILMNLTTNARDAMSDGGKLTIKTDISEIDEAFKREHGYGAFGKYVLLTVSDTGTGMDEEIKGNIFEPFFTTKETGKGSGLGLAVTYGIEKQHDGFIDVETAPQKGTTFRIYFPVVEAKEVHQENRDVSSATGGVETILLAEDDTEMRKIMRDVLSLSGYKVIEANDGEDAVRAFMKDRDRIDLAFLDVRMPKKNGRMVYDEIKRGSPEFKILFMSGYTENIIDSHGISEEGFNFISKTASPDEILRKIREVLDNVH